MTPLSPLDLFLAAVLSLRRFGMGRTLLASVVLIPLYLWTLPPVVCSCFGPVFRRCDSSLRYVAAMRSDLRILASQQEIYFADHGEYSTDLEALGFVGSEGVSLDVSVRGDGWIASATHPLREDDRHCGIYGGEPGPWAGLVTDLDPDTVTCRL